MSQHARPRRRHRIPTLALAALSAVAASARAGTYHWVSPVSGTFTDSFNWSPAGIPNTGDVAKIDADNATHDTYHVYLFPSTPVGNITLFSPGAQLDLRLVNGDTHTPIDSLNINWGVLNFVNGNGTGINYLDIGTAFNVTQFGDVRFNEGGTWQINGTVNNSGGNIPGSSFGGIHLNSYVVFTGTVNNSGVIDTPNTPGYYTNFNPGSTFVNQPGGSLNIAPNYHFKVIGGTFDYQGGSVNGTVEMFADATLKTATSVVGNNTAQFKFVNNGFLASDLAGGVNVSVPAILTATSGVNNYGTIHLENSNGVTAATIRAGVDGSGFFVNYGNVYVDTGSILDGRYYNRWLTFVTQPLTAGHVINGNPSDDSGSFTVWHSDTLISNNAGRGVFQQSAGVLHTEAANNAHLILDNSTFNYDGGVVEGNTVLLRNNSNFTGSTADGHDATFKYVSDGTLGRVPEHTNIIVEGHVVTAGSLDNYGTIQLKTQDFNAANILVPAGVTFPNRGNLDFYYGGRVDGSVYSIGAIHFYGAGYVQGSVQNDFIFDVSPSATADFSNNSTLRQTGGPMTIYDHGQLTINHSTFSYEGGTITTLGTGSIHLVNESHLKTPVASIPAATFYLDRENSIDTDLAKNITVNANDATLTVIDGQTNRGTINLAYTNAVGPSMRVLVPDASLYTGQYTNAGTIRYLSSGSFYGSLDNAPGSSFRTSGWLNFYNGNVWVGPNSTFTIDAGMNVWLNGPGGGNPNATFTVNGGSLSIGKNAHLNMINADLIFASGTLDLAGAAVVKTAPGGIPAASILSTAGAGSSLSIATTGVDLDVAGGIIGNDGASIAITGGISLITNDGGSLVAKGGALITNDGGSFVALANSALITNDGGSIVASGAGNIVATGGGNIISGNASAIVASGAGNIISGNGSAIISGNGSASSAGVITSDDHVQLLTTSPTSTITLQGGSLQAPGGAIAIGSDGALTGCGAASAHAAYSAGNISPTGGTLTVNAPLALVGGTITGDSTLLITQPLSITGPVSISQSPTLHTTSTFSIAAGGSIDLTSRSATLLFDNTGSTPSLVQQYLSSHQLFSSTADNDPNHLLTLVATDTGPATSVRLTYFGDVNLDGHLNLDDYALLDRAYDKHLPPSWSTGDFNRDGLVNDQDYLLIDRSFALQGNSFSADFLASRESQFGSGYIAHLMTSIPEPTTLAWLATPAIVTFCRRRPVRLN